MLIAAAVLIPCLGLLLLSLGMRGRRIDDHPICTACRFDLVGLTEPATCPECGVKLGSDGTIRTGARRARRAMVGAGVLLLLISVVGLTSFFAGASLEKYKPSALLLLESRILPPDRSVPAITELQARSDHQRLSNADRATLARRALQIQTYAALPFPREWAGILGDANFVGALSQAEQQAAATNGANPQILYRKSVRSGHPIPVEVRMICTDRFVNFGAATTAKSMHVTIKGDDGSVLHDFDQSSRVHLNTFRGGWTSMHADVQRDLPPGRYTIELSMDIAIPSLATIGTVAVPIHTSGPLNVVPSDQHTVLLLRNPTLGKQLTTGVMINPALQAPQPSGKRYLGIGMGSYENNDALSVRVWLWQHKAHALYRCRLSAPGLPDIDGGTVGVSADDTSLAFLVGGAEVPADTKPGPYTLHLVPDIETAERSVEIEAILDEQLSLDAKVTEQARPVGTATPVRK